MASANSSWKLPDIPVSNVRTFVDELYVAPHPLVDSKRLPENHVVVRDVGTAPSVPTVIATVATPVSGTTIGAADDVAGTALGSTQLQVTFTEGALVVDVICFPDVTARFY